MIRRFVYDAAADAVVEIAGPKRHRFTGPDSIWTEAKSNLDALPWGEEGSETTRIVEAAQDRADRREFAHKRYGDERRWRET